MNASPDRILFGSCHSQHYESMVWLPMAERRPAAFVWAGDSIYADSFEPIPPPEQTSFFDRFQRRVKDATPEKLELLYKELLNHTGYWRFRQGARNGGEKEEFRRPVILGTFDDHDFGRNNGDRNFPYKKQSASLFMEFIQESNVDPSSFELMANRARTGRGLYGVKVFDFERPPNKQMLSDAEAGLDPEISTDQTINLSHRSVAVLVLDCRTHRTPWPNRSFFDPSTSDGDFLGETQWQWLERGLKRSTASINIVVQGLQVHADHMFDGSIVEEWSRFPNAQRRLYQALLQSNVKVPVLVSGDVHMFQLSRKDCRRVHQINGRIVVGEQFRPLFEITTSGMVHSWGTLPCSTPNGSFLCTSPYFHSALRLALHWAHMNGSWRELLRLDRTEVFESAKSGSQYSLHKNFAELEFDWEMKQLRVRALGVVDGMHPPLSSSRWDFDFLNGHGQYVSEVPNNAFSDLFRVQSSSEPLGKSEWVCISYRGPSSLTLKIYGIATSVFVFLSAGIFPICLPVILAAIFLKRKVCQHPTNGHQARTHK